MAHYFDDIFTRHSKPKNSKPHLLRRSSTARSIGARSDFDSHTNGDHDDETRSLKSVGPEDLENEHDRSERDAHLNNYVTEQLERVRSYDSGTFRDADEFEAQLDEH